MNVFKKIATTIKRVFHRHYYETHSIVYNRRNGDIVSKTYCRECATCGKKVRDTVLIFPRPDIYELHWKILSTGQTGILTKVDFTKAEAISSGINDLIKHGTVRNRDEVIVTADLVSNIDTYPMRVNNQEYYKKEIYGNPIIRRLHFNR